MQTGWLTLTKFMSPCLRDDHVARKHLLETLHAAINAHPLTLLSTPPGYGKTTLLASLSAGFPELPIVWISLDEEDNDPARFLNSLVSALELNTEPAVYASMDYLLERIPPPSGIGFARDGDYPGYSIQSVTLVAIPW